MAKIDMKCRATGGDICEQKWANMAELPEVSKSSHHEIENSNSGSYYSIFHNRTFSQESLLSFDQFDSLDMGLLGPA
jgi:hypothetical protein